MRSILFVTVIAALVATQAVLSVSAFATPVDTPTPAPADRARHLSRTLDRLYRADASHGTMRMKVITPDYERELKMEVWSRGMDDTLVRIRSPRKEKGTSTLKRGNEMWNYLPKIKKTIRIPPSMMMGAWMGSDFTNDDLMRESSWETDYTVGLGEAPLAGQICLDYTPKPDAAVTWSKVTVCFDEASEMPTTQTFFDEKGRAARRMTLDDVKVLGGRTLPARMTLVPLLESGRKTVVIYDAMEFDVDHPDNLFSITRLRRSR